MDYRYRINISDKEEALSSLKGRGDFLIEAKKKEDENAPFFLVPLQKEEELVLVSKTPLDLSAYKERNETREKVRLKILKADKIREKGNLFALLGAFLVLLTLGSAFFAIGFGMKQGAGYYALLIVTLALSYLTYLTLKYGARRYADSREKKRQALSLLSSKEKEE